MASPGARAGYARASRAHDIGRQVRARREKIGMTQRQLAEQIGTSQSAIARLEAGGAEPRLSTLERISEVLEAKLVVQLA